MKKFFPILLFFVLITAVAAQAPDRSPLSQSPGGKRVLAYFAAFNSGDEQTLRTFFLENISADGLKERPVEPRLAFHRQVRSDFKAVEIRKVVSMTDAEIKVLAQSVNGAWISYSFLFDAATGKFAGFQIGQTDAPADAAKPAVVYEAPATLANLLTTTERMFADLSKADLFSGVVMIAKDGQPILQKAYGYANAEKKTSNVADTKFNLGSINKVFTRVAIGQLVKAGKLSFDDKLIKILPDYPNREAAAKITIGNLVDMTSGIGDMFNDKFFGGDKLKIRTLNDYLPLFASEPLEFEPGTKNRYSNGGYVVLGLVIEKLSGMTYYDYVRKNIFEPAGMSDTGSYEIDKLPSNTAIGYERAANGRQPNSRSLPGRGSSAGGGYSTTADLLKFANALRSKKLEIPDDKGGFPAEFKGTGIAGGSEGVNAVFITNGQTGYTIIVLSNYEPPSAEKPGMQVRDWLKQIKE
ncbi:MAG: serine hydrolase domain-containing protein [Acidobacteriota bacterium]